MLFCLNNSSQVTKTHTHTNHDIIMIYPYCITRSVFKDPIFGSKNWKQAFRRDNFKVPFFVVRISEGHLWWVHTILSSELTKNLQFSAKKMMQNLSVPFNLSRRVSDENRICCISISFFFKITDPLDGRSFLMCSHESFFGTNKNRILKNGWCE